LETTAVDKKLAPGQEAQKSSEKAVVTRMEDVMRISQLKP